MIEDNVNNIHVTGGRRVNTLIDRNVNKHRTATIEYHVNIIINQPEKVYFLKLVHIIKTRGASKYNHKISH